MTKNKGVASTSISSIILNVNILELGHRRNKHYKNQYHSTEHCFFTSPHRHVFESWRSVTWSSDVASSNTPPDLVREFGRICDVPWRRTTGGTKVTTRVHCSHVPLFHEKKGLELESHSIWVIIISTTVKWPELRVSTIFKTMPKWPFTYSKPTNLMDICDPQLIVNRVLRSTSWWAKTRKTHESRHIFELLKPCV